MKNTPPLRKNDITFGPPTVLFARHSISSPAYRSPLTSILRRSMMRRMPPNSHFASTKCYSFIYCIITLSQQAPSEIILQNAYQYYFQHVDMPSITTFHSSYLPNFISYCYHDARLPVLLDNEMLSRASFLITALDFLPTNDAFTLKNSYCSRSAFSRKASLSSIAAKTRRFRQCRSSATPTPLAPSKARINIMYDDAGIIGHAMRRHAIADEHHRQAPVSRSSTSADQFDGSFHAALTRGVHAAYLSPMARRWAPKTSRDTRRHTAGLKPSLSGNARVAATPLQMPCCTPTVADRHYFLCWRKAPTISLAADGVTTPPMPVITLAPRQGLLASFLASPTRHYIYLRARLLRC